MPVSLFWGSIKNFGELFKKTRKVHACRGDHNLKTSLFTCRSAHYDGVGRKKCAQAGCNFKKNNLRFPATPFRALQDPIMFSLTVLLSCVVALCVAQNSTVWKVGIKEIVPFVIFDTGRLLSGAVAYHPMHVSAHSFFQLTFVLAPARLWKASSRMASPSS